MRQIDIMVENKRLEWEHQLQSVQLQVERRDRDIIKLRETVELRNQEVGKFQQQIDGQADSHRHMISQYEEQVQRLKGEIDHVKKNYAKLQRNSSKQATEADRKNAEALSELEKREQELRRGRGKLEELEDKIQDQEVIRKSNEDRIYAMEGQRKALIEKSELMQDQLLGYQGQLTRKKQLLDALEQKYATLAARHDNEVMQYKEDLKFREETISRLRKSLDEAVNNDEKNTSEFSKLREDIEKFSKKNKILERDNTKLEETVRLKDEHLKVREEDLKRQVKELLGLQKMLRDKDESLRQYEEVDERERSDLTGRLRQDLESLKNELLEKTRTEEVLRDKIGKQEMRINDLCDECNKLRDKLLIKSGLNVAHRREWPKNGSSKNKSLT